ncbi:fumarate reductase/succinate dehydrogenase flavoprotein subunit [Desulfobacter hydrogenophilus]|uniref:succinate dehydrogenase n=1 Tax=Desulfobacter hydrogenophilus TaxID=2291 RepID=A0A328FCZ7_9BACT|nr:fumarate reductase/succinate dehydrogenase flavoprotein subunit [Desulfobacter hydrogenophilus]NDY70553.1 fumarate reductase/succinate dehydrogenase flavoprotein subunit [Desulfobacter hydrogenophilus]QBH13926.1 fumarate reductase/succinate dehydrogenase flavoprotein subunit [Desulfobacter hydrogenophilus]RAM02159.1 fumarate reductase/succinate dehydrogenase flavoprotein subunit [Desulfobacter hydrogenophilus]
MQLNSNVPSGPLEGKWDRYKFDLKKVNPANKRKFEVIVVGTGLAGGSAAATMADLGYHVKNFCIQDTPRRAHSIAAQGGINAAKNYPGDGDSVYNLFYDTIKGGDYRAREANVYRLAQNANAIIDHCVATGVPFAREYGGLHANRSFGGAQVSRTFYARGQTGQQLLLGVYGQLSRQIGLGGVEMYSRRDILDIVVVDGCARGVVCRNLVTGEIESHSAHAVVLATGGYDNVYFLTTSGMHSNVSACWAAYKKGAAFANPCYTQIHPTCITVHGDYQSKLTLMSESLRNDGRIWVPKKAGDNRSPDQIPENERDYYLERKYPSFGNLVPRDVASRNAKMACDEGRGVGNTGLAVYLDFSEAIKRDGEDVIRAKYGNLFQMYDKIQDENPYKVPMKIYPAIHYVMGGTWVDYNLMTTRDGLFCLGGANFSDHGANRLGASALMQGLSDGYFVLPYTIGGYLATQSLADVDTSHQAFKDSEKQLNEKLNKLMNINGKRTVDDIHKELGHYMWEYCGMARNEAGLKTALQKIPALREEFWQNVNVTGSSKDFNQTLEKAYRLADYLEFGELLARDALTREESCGGHFREESQTEENEAKRDDENFCHAAAWEYAGEGKDPILNKEPLVFESVKLTQRSYK